MSFDPMILFLTIVIGSIGLALFMYGKKQARIPQIAVGLALMFYPYFVSTPLLTVGIAVLLLLMLWVMLRVGW